VLYHRIGYCFYMNSKHFYSIMKFFVPIIHTKNNDERKNKFRIYKEIQFLVKKYGEEESKRRSKWKKRKRYITHHKRIYPCDSGVLKLWKPEANLPVYTNHGMPAPPKRASCIFQKT
jgi:hypothetical protein